MGIQGGSRRLILWLGLGAFGVVISLVLAVGLLVVLEAYLRHVTPESSVDSIFEYTGSTRRYKVLRPSTTTMVYGVPLSTNALGFRSEREYVPAKEPGEFRIVVLGDSFSMGAGVPYAQLYTTLLEETLRKTYPGARVLNLAVGGYNIIQYSLVLDEVALDLHPDVVMVALFPFNDFSNEDYEENRRVAGGGAPAVQWYQRLLVYRAYISKVMHLLKLQGVPALGAAQPDVQRTQNINALQHIIRTTRARQITLLTAILPTTSAVDKQLGWVRSAEDHCRALGIACVNLLEAFDKSGHNPRQMRLNPADDHPNGTYHRIVADLLAPRIRPLLPPQ